MFTVGLFLDFIIIIFFSFLLFQPSLKTKQKKMSLDLCSEDTFTGEERSAEVLPSRVTLELIPNVKNTDELLASEIVVAALGKGKMTVTNS